MRSRTTAIAAVLCTVAFAAGASGAEAAATAAGCVGSDPGTKVGKKLIGSSVDDRLKGAGTARQIVGLAGEDCLAGGARGERFLPGRGKDLVVARGGRDRIIARDGTRDLIRCGKGRDRARADRHDVTFGCERVKVGKAGPQTEPPADATGSPQDSTSDPTSTPAGDCSLQLAALIAPGCAVLKSDTSATADPEPLWGNIDCENDSRHAVVDGGADPHPTATGAAQSNDAYRRLSVFDGDDFWGERCELGRNEHRHGDGDEDGTFALFQEGQRRITFLSARIPDSALLAVDTWQTVMQMKQAQPSDNGGGTPILEMQAFDDQFRLHTQGKPLWTTDAQAGVWTRFAYDVTYSQNPSVGQVTVYADLNADGDAGDEGEQSPTISTATLKVESAGGTDDGLDAGDSIPSHLRAGVYHNPSIDCATGCSVDIDNVQVVAP